MKTAKKRPAPQGMGPGAGVGDLINQIETCAHARLKVELPRLEAALEKLARTQGPRHPELIQLHRLVSQFWAELQVHMFKEEHVLFVLCRQLKEAGKVPGTCAGSIRRPVEAMIHEHELAHQDWAQMRELTRGYKAPAGAAPAYVEILAALASLEAEVLEHMRMEDQVLFPKAMIAEAELRARASGNSAGS